MASSSALSKTSLISIPSYLAFFFNSFLILTLITVVDTYKYRHTYINLSVYEHLYTIQQYTLTPPGLLLSVMVPVSPIDGRRCRIARMDLLHLGVPYV
jgi:hypothetical protein